MPDVLDATFAALSDPTRRGILAQLSTGECSVGELAEAFPITQSAVSRHLQVLEQAGLITRRREGQRRLCRLEDAPFDAASAWIDRTRAEWEARLDRLGEIVAGDARASKADR